MNNPLLSFGHGLPHYDQVKPEHIQPAIQELLSSAQEAVHVSVSHQTPNTWCDLVEPLENATEALGRSWGVISHLNSVADTPELREAYGQMLPEVTSFWSSLGQNLDLYEKYKALSQSAEFETLNAAQKKVIQNSLRDFKLGGAELSHEQKHRFSEIQEEQAQLSKAFSDHVLDATDSFTHHVTDQDALAGLPDDVIEAAKATALSKELAGWAFTLHFPSYFPVMQFSENRELRKTLYQAYVTRASDLSEQYASGKKEWDNTDNMLKQLRLKNEEAQLLGFANYAALSIAPKMAKSVLEVDEFLETFAKRAKSHGQRDWDDLINFAKTSLNISQIEPWDVAYVSEKLKQARYAFSENEVKQYFPLPKVLEGLFHLTEVLFGVKIENDNLPTWHKDVQSFKVLNHQNALVANFYLDPYARPGKRGGAWMDDARGRRLFADGSVQTPVAYLVCNFPSPVTVNGVTKAPTITHDDVITLFHECGHGLHHMLTQVDVLGVSGINGVEWDAVELPSQFMENFCWEWEVLEKMTSHVDTGAPLPKALFEKMIAAKNFQNGLATLRQIVFSLTDWRLHSSFSPDLAKNSDILGLARMINDEIHVIPQATISRWPNTFSHIFAGGYSAGYYSYKWAEVLSADAYGAFEEAAKTTGSVLDPITGERYRKEILEVGGSRPAAESFKAFRGRDPQIDALLRHGGLA
jgi:oligopeptidase A